MSTTLQPVIFDGGLVVRGSSATLQLPSGTLANRPSPTTDGQIRQNTTSTEIDAYTGGIWKSLDYKTRWTLETANFTIPAGDSGIGYWVDTRTNAITVSLPISPSAGMIVYIADYGSSAPTNNITIDPHGLNINSSTSTFIIAEANQLVGLQYVDATVGWKTISAYVDLTSINASISGVYNINMASGSVVLTQQHASNAIFILSGVLTSNVTLTIPSGQTGQWTIQNNTTGSYSVTFQTAASGGTTVPVVQGSSNELWSDGTNIKMSSVEILNTSIAYSTVVQNNALAYSIIFG